MSKEKIALDGGSRHGEKWAHSSQSDVIRFIKDIPHINDLFGASCLTEIHKEIELYRRTDFKLGDRVVYKFFEEKLSNEQNKKNQLRYC